VAVLITDIQRAQTIFAAESSRYPAAETIDTHLRSALLFARAAGSLALDGRKLGSIQNRLQTCTSRLGEARNLVQGGAGTAPGQRAHASNTVAPTVIGPAVTLSPASRAPRLAFGSLGTVSGDPNVSPLAATSNAATEVVADALPIELAGATVTIGRWVAPLLYVSPERIAFVVPAGLPSGETEVIVTSQEGYVSRGTTMISAVAPGLFTTAGGAAIVFNATGGNAAVGFDVMSPQTLGYQRTRLQLFATGISANAALNTYPGNDITLESGRVANFAEAVSMQARTSDGRTLSLPVEFAGANSRLAGADQVCVVLVEALRGAGTVELTLFIGGQRGNTATVNIR